MVPAKVAELYEHAEKARQRAEALANRPTALQLEDELQPSFVSLQLSVRGEPDQIRRTGTSAWG